MRLSSDADHTVVQAKERARRFCTPPRFEERLFVATHFLQNHFERWVSWRIVNPDETDPHCQVYTGESRGPGKPVQLSFSFDAEYFYLPVKVNESCIICTVTDTQMGGSPVQIGCASPGYYLGDLIPDSKVYDHRLIAPLETLFELVSARLSEPETFLADQEAYHTDRRARLEVQHSQLRAFTGDLARRSREVMDRRAAIRDAMDPTYRVHLGQPMKLRINPG